jgi:hypothetical protein
VIERRVQVLPGYGAGHRVKPSLNMSRDELRRLNDHDLLVLLHERLQAHMDEHRQGTIAFRWTVAVIISALGVLFVGAGVVASLGNP